MSSTAGQWKCGIIIIQHFNWPAVDDMKRNIIRNLQFANIIILIIRYLKFAKETVHVRKVGQTLTTRTNTRQTTGLNYLKKIGVKTHISFLCTLTQQSKSSSQLMNHSIKNTVTLNTTHIGRAMAKYGTLNFSCTLENNTLIGCTVYGNWWH